jgi:predicted TPR repeat methyltransferase
MASGVDKLLRKAGEKYQQGSARGAADIYKKILAREPKHLDANYLLGALYAEQGQLEPALKYTRIAASINPNSPWVQNNLGNLLRLKGEHASAITAYQKALAIKPDFAEVYSNLGIAHYRLGQTNEAIQAYEQALRLQPGLTQARLNLGNLLQDSGEFASAAQCFERVLTADPHNIRALKKLGKVYLEQGEDRKAIECFEHCLAQDPQDQYGVRAKLAFLRRADTPDKLPATLIRETYETKALNWDRDVHQAEHQFFGAENILRALQQLGLEEPDLQVLDLGCGTGACGTFLRPLAAHLEGVDLSQPMLDVAAQKQLYDKLACDDIVSYLQQHPARYDLITASGVLIFFGDLTPVLQAARKALRPGGHLVFTLYEGSDDIRVRHNFHFEHSQAYLRRQSDEVGLEVVQLIQAEHELHDGVPQAGLVVALRLPA